MKSRCACSTEESGDRAVWVIYTKTESAYQAREKVRTGSAFTIDTSNCVLSEFVTESGDEASFGGPFRTGLRRRGRGETGSTPRDSGEVRRQETGDVERNRHESRLAESTRPRVHQRQGRRCRRQLGDRARKRRRSSERRMEPRFAQAGRRDHGSGHCGTKRKPPGLGPVGRHDRWRKESPRCGDESIGIGGAQPASSPGATMARRAAQAWTAAWRNWLLGSAERQRTRRERRQNPDGCLRAFAQHRGRRQGRALSALGPRFI